MRDEIIGQRITYRETRKGKTRIVEGVVLRIEPVNLVDKNGNQIAGAGRLLLHLDNGLNIWTVGMAPPTPL